MKDLTLTVVNWNQRPVIELLLKSYVKHHYTGEPLKLMLTDNGSNDDSKQWLTENQVPFIDCPINIGHETALNMIYKKIDTRYCLVTDSDVEFAENIFGYLDHLNDTCVAAGELISGDNLGTPIMPRIAPWFLLFDIQKLREVGIIKFRDTTNHSYDTGSWISEKIFQAGLTHHQIPRRPGNIDRDVIGMDYGAYRHLGKMSWATSNCGKSLMLTISPRLAISPS